MSEDSKQKVFPKSWEEFRATGLLWWINHTLHLFGWAIVVEVEDGTGRGGAHPGTEKIVKVYPARVKFRGFDSTSTEQGFVTLTNYMKQNAPELMVEATEDLSPGIVVPE